MCRNYSKILYKSWDIIIGILCLVDCHSSCRSCSGGSSRDCTSCLSPRVLRSGRCISGCPDEEYNHNGTCRCVKTRVLKLELQLTVFLFSLSW